MKTPDDTNSWESEMGDEFERRVRDLHEAPLDLTTVKGTAMKIRNRRRAAIAGGVLAAAAVIVPVAVIATNSASDRSDSIQPAVPSATVTDPVSPAPTPTPKPADPTPTSLPDGPALGFDYLEVGSGDAIYHEADGTVVALPGKDYVDATDLGGQVAAYRRSSNGGETAVDVIEDGQVTRTYDVRSAMAIAPDGRTVAFITTDDELLFVNGKRDDQSFGTIERGVTLSAIIGNGDCALETGCHPFLEHEDFTERDAYEINYEGPDTAPAPGALRVNDAADGFLVSVQTEATDTGSCGGLYDREGGGRWVFETCDSQVLDISPTGDYVVGTDPYGDGIGPGYFSILDTEGDEVARYEADQGYVLSDYTWQDDTHVVAVVFERGQWQIVSLAIDGSSEVVLGPVDAEEPDLAPFLVTGGDAG